MAAFVVVVRSRTGIFSGVTGKFRPMATTSSSVCVSSLPDRLLITSPHTKPMRFTSIVVAEMIVWVKITFRVLRLVLCTVKSSEVHVYNGVDRGLP